MKQHNTLSIKNLGSENTLPLLCIRNAYLLAGVFISAALIASLLLFSHMPAMSVGSSAPDGCTPLDFGQTITRTLATGAVDCYTFEGTSGDHILARGVGVSGGLNLRLTIWRSDGRELCNELGELICPLNGGGVHKLLVEDTWGMRTGNYGLHLQRTNTPGGCSPIGFDTSPLSAAFALPAEIDCFTFEGDAGSQVRMRAVATSGGLNLVVRLFRFDGTQLCTGLNDLTCQLDVSGKHAIMVNDTWGARTGSYQMNLSCLSTVCQGGTPTPTATPTTPSPTPTIPSPTPTPTILTPTPTSTTTCQPGIEFTSIPSYDSTDDLQGRVTCIDPANHTVAVYIYPQNWWTKPYFDDSTTPSIREDLTPIGDDGSWITDITTGGIDECATQIAAFLLPKDYNPPRVEGATKLPDELYQRSVAHVMVMRSYPRTIQFSGYTWHVKTCKGPLGPHQNDFSDRAEDVFVDSLGYLHLRIAQRDGKWYATEVVGADSLGYGTYVFTFASRVDQLDKNVVLGAFTWNDKVPDYNHREMDIEFSRWGEEAAPNAQFVVQPFHLPDHRHRFYMTLTGEESTHRLTWQPGSAHFASFQGMSQDAGNLIEAWPHAHDDIPPVGGETPRINLWLFGHQPPSNGQAVEVIVESFTFEPLSPLTITAIRPNQGRNDIANLIDIAGANFAPGAVVSLGSAALTTTFVSTAHLQAIVPAGVAAGVYDVTVANPAGERATQSRGYTAFDPVNNDDLFALEYEFYLDPVTPRANAPTDLILKVHRQGGKDPLFDVKVRFYQGDPKSNGLLIGNSTLPSLAPRGEEQSIPLRWTPTAAGNYTLYAVIDPENLIAESYEENNTVARTVIVLPPAPDQEAPHVDSFTINGGAATTSERVVRLDTQASDEPSPGGVAKLRFVEYAYREAAGIWVPVQQSDWLDYATASTNFSWQLLPPGGVKALHVWVADAAGNISRFPYRRQINYMPPSEHVQFNQRQLYRYTLNAGQTLVAQLTALSGDPDLYLWPPDHTTRPPWVSNLRTAVDDVSITAPVAGVYQIEVYGFSAAHYQLAVTLGNIVAAQSQGGRDPSKEDLILREPLLAPTAQPDDRFAMLTPGTSNLHIFLPIALR